jgi:hypothetical protein
VTRFGSAAVQLLADLGPWSQNVALPTVTRLVGGRRVMLPLPIENQEIVEDSRERIASGFEDPSLRTVGALVELGALS